jgi:membrane protease YdiL (CAAX protease family)
LFALVGIPAITVLGAVVLPGVQATFQMPGLSLLLTYPISFIVSLVIGGQLGEEPGWRGFALPRLQRLRGPFVGSLTLGLLWAFWHLPYFWMPEWGTPKNSVIDVVWFVLADVALTIVYTWVFNNTKGSLLIVILVHASNDAFFINQLFLAPVVATSLLPFVIGFGTAAVLLLIFTKGRLRQLTTGIRIFVFETAKELGGRPCLPLRQGPIDVTGWFAVVTVIVDVEATPARTYDEVAATRTMIDRTETTFGLKPGRLAADTAYGTGKLLAWLRLRELGWIEGRTVGIEYRYGEGRHERFAEIAANIAELPVNQTQKLVAKFGSQHGVGRKDDRGPGATSQRDPNGGEQELPLHGDLPCIVGR